MYQQERIVKAITIYAQVINNFISYEAPGINYIDAPLSDKDKTTPQQIILGLKGLTEETKDKNIFISIEKDQLRNYILFHKKKFYYNVLTIANHLLAVTNKQYSGDILYIFEPYYQDLAKEVV